MSDALLKLRDYLKEDIRKIIKEELAIRIQYTGPGVLSVITYLGSEMVSEQHVPITPSPYFSSEQKMEILRMIRQDLQFHLPLKEKEFT